MLMRGIILPNLVGSIVSRFAVLSAALIIGAMCTSGAWAAAFNPSGEPGVAPSSHSSSDQLQGQDTSFIARSVKRLVKEGYAVDGPTQVIEIGPAFITLFTGQKKNWTIDLSGKKVFVRDYKGDELLMSNVEKGSKIYTCIKGENAVIFVLEKKEKSNDH